MASNDSLPIYTHAGLNRVGEFIQSQAHVKFSASASAYSFSHLPIVLPLLCLYPVEGYIRRW